METLFYWIKWKTYIRWHSTWGAFYFVKGKWSHRLGLVILLIDTLKAVLYTTVYYSIFKFIIFNEGLLSIEDQGSTVQFIVQQISSLQNNTIILWNLYFLILLIFCTFAGVKSSIWSQFSEDKILLANTKWPKKYTNSLLLLESIVWNYRTFTLSIVSLGISLNLATGVSSFHLFTFFVVINLFYLTLSFSFAIMHYLYVIYRSYWMKGSILIVQLLLSRTLVLFFGYKIASLFHHWIQEIPFYSRNFTNAEIESWVHSGYSIISENISFLFTAEWIPYNYIAKSYYDNDLGMIILIILTIALLDLFIIFKFKNLFMLDEYKFEYNYTLLPIMEKFHFDFIFRIPILNRSKSYFKMFFRSPIAFKKLGNLGGSLMFWGLIGIFGGLLIGADLSKNPQFSSCI